MGSNYLLCDGDAEMEKRIKSSSFSQLATVCKGRWDLLLLYYSMEARKQSPPFTLLLWRCKETIRKLTSIVPGPLNEGIS